MVHHKLVRLGYGTMAEVKAMPVDEVLDALFYEKFLRDYERAYVEMSK